MVANRVDTPRSSNLELYRIICMLLIVAHHFVVNSGLWAPMDANPNAANTLFLLLFGMWGKIGINCFMMITGYFMCKGNITWRKFWKLLLWIYLYKIVIYIIFLSAGYETFTLLRVAKIIMPIWDIDKNFTSCFFYSGLLYRFGIY